MINYIQSYVSITIDQNNVCIISSTLRIHWIMIIIKNFNFFIMYVFYRFQLGRETYCGCWLYCHPLDWPSSSEIVLPWWQHLQVRCFEYCMYVFHGKWFEDNQKHIYSNQKHTANWIKISSAHSEGKYFMHWCVEELKSCTLYCI